MTAQAFLHCTPASRRTVDNGGALAEPLGDVCDTTTLHSICVSLRMAVYDERAAAKEVEWRRLISSVEYKVRLAAKVADVDEFCRMCGYHAHGLPKDVFWGLWRAAKDDNRALGYSISPEGESGISVQARMTGLRSQSGFSNLRSWYS